MLGYVPDGAARALASRRSRSVGAVVRHWTSDLAHATQACSERSRKPATRAAASHEYDAIRRSRCARTGRARRDGLACGTDHAPALYEFLARSGVPFELTWALDPDRHRYCVGFSNRLASIRMTQHLLDLGHREFAMVSGYTAHNDRARERVAGVREALAAHGLALPDHRYVETAFSVSSGRAALAALLSRGQAPTAIACGNDLLAFGVLLECAARGSWCRSKMSVAGSTTSSSPPRLSAVDDDSYPTAYIGRRAAERLLAHSRASALHASRMSGGTGGSREAPRRLPRRRRRADGRKPGSTVARRSARCPARCPTGASPGTRLPRTAVRGCSGDSRVAADST